MTTYQRLEKAIFAKKLNVLKKLLSTITWNELGEYAHHLLYTAASLGHYSEFLCLLDVYPTHEEKSGVLEQLIIIVAEQGHIKLLKFIIKKFFPLGSQNRNTLIEGDELKEVINRASSNGHGEIVQKLLALYPNPTIRLSALQNSSHFGKTNGPLHNAIYSGHSEMVYLLLSKYPSTKKSLLMQDEFLLKDAVTCGKLEIAQAVFNIYTDNDLLYNAIKNKNIFHALLNGSNPDPKIVQFLLKAALSHKNFNLKDVWYDAVGAIDIYSDNSEDIAKNVAVLQILQMVFENLPVSDRLNVIKNSGPLSLLIKGAIIAGNVVILKSILDVYSEYSEDRKTLISCLFYLMLHSNRQNDSDKPYFTQSLEDMAAAHQTDMVQIILDFLLQDPNYLDSIHFFDNTKLLYSDVFNQFLVEALQKEDCPEALIQFAQRPLPRFHLFLLNELKKSTDNAALVRLAKQPALRRSIITALLDQARELLDERKAQEAYDLLDSAIHVEEDGSLITPLAKVVQIQLPTQSHSWFHRQRGPDPEVANIKLWMKQIIQTYPEMGQNRVNQNRGRSVHCW